MLFRSWIIRDKGGYLWIFSKEPFKTFNPEWDVYSEWLPKGIDWKAYPVADSSDYAFIRYEDEKATRFIEETTRELDVTQYDKLGSVLDTKA